jgi:hypothetical protein
VQAGSSLVNVENVKSDAIINSSYKSIQAKNIGGALTIDGGSSSVIAEGIGGDLTVTNSYKYVIIKGTSGSIVVNGQSSPIEVSQIKSLPKTGKIELITSYKPITLELPDNPDVEIYASYQYGKLYSDFPVYVNKEDEIQAKIGKGIIPIKLITSSDIKIKKAN